MLAQENSEFSEDKPKKAPGTGFKGGNSAINRSGRKPGVEKALTNRALKERELLMLLRKIRPYVSSAVTQAAKIMNNDEASDQNSLRAAAILLDAYRKLTLDLYDSSEPEAEGVEVQQQNQPTLSLRVIGNNDE